MDERELKSRLEDAAEAAAGHAARNDLAEVELRVGRVRARRRWATGLVAAMLVAGAGGVGFGLGRSVDRQPAGEAIAPADTSPPAAPETVAPEAVAPATEPATPPAPPSPPAEAAVDAPAATLGVEPSNAPGIGSGEAELTTAGDMAPYAPQPMTLLGSRELADGTRVRVQLGQQWDMGEMGLPGGFQPAAWCWADQELRVTVDGPDLVDVIGMSVYTDLGSAPLALVAQRSEFGYSDGRPLRVLVVQSAAGDTAATVRWDDGATDTADFIDGIVVLVADGTNAWEHTYELDVTGPDGTRTVTNADVEEVYSLPDWRASCEPPPPALPPAGEQPADPTAAEEALRADFAALWDRAIPREDKEHLLDDWTGVGEAIDAVDTGTYAEAAASAVQAIDELVFTSPTEAWFRYSITTDISDFHDRYGRATLVDGSWQFPRGIMCQDLQLASATCVPPAAPIYPPSWYEINGSAWFGGCDAEGNCLDCQVFADGREECTEHTVAIEAGAVPGELAPATTAPAGP
jgi:hypothetical protein